MRSAQLCAYCGSLAFNKDHVDGSVLPVCLECSGALRSALSATFLERLDYVRRFYSNKYRSYLQAPDWSKEELDELGPAMRAAIAGAVEFTSFVRARLSYAAHERAEKLVQRLHVC